MGIYGLGVILAPALGPTLGGVLIDNYSWRYTFFACLPLCLFGMLPAPIFLPTRRQSSPPPFDWLGFVLVAVAIGSFLAGLSNGQRLGWDLNFVLGGFSLSAICFCRLPASGALDRRSGHRPRRLSQPPFRRRLGGGVHARRRAVQLDLSRSAVRADGSGLHADRLGPAARAGGRRTRLRPAFGRKTERPFPRPRSHHDRDRVLRRLQLPDDRRRHLDAFLDASLCGWSSAGWAWG